MKKLSTVFTLVISGLLLLSGCSKTETASLSETALLSDKTVTTEQTAIESANTGETTALEDTALTAAEKKSDNFYDNVKLLGRTYVNDGVLWCALSGTGAEFTAQGAKLVINFHGSNAASTPNNEKNWARVGIYVNGERVVDTQIDEAFKAVEIALSPDEISTVKIVKLSESVESIFGISHITVDGVTGKISPVPENDFFIEFIGDSITCGYGVDDPVKEHNFSTATEDFTDTYAYITAENLSADYSAVAYSGHGIISGYTGNGVKQPGQIVPRFYSKVGNSYDTAGGKNISEIEWSFPREPDLIVINLGSNDDSYCGSDIERQREFVEKYVEFLAEIRKLNPNAAILCSLGVLGDRLCPCVEEAAASYTEDTGDSNIYTLRFEVQNGEFGYAADWHPSAGTHEQMATKLTTWIENNIII